VGRFEGNAYKNNPHTHTHTHKSTHELTPTHRINLKTVTETAMWAAFRQEGSILITCLPGVNMQAISKSCFQTRRLLQYRLLTWVVCGVSAFGWAFSRRHLSAYFSRSKVVILFRDQTRRFPNLCCCIVKSIL
jgi:hypothetical protein